MTIYFKTPQGVGEIANRSGAVGQRARRLLILIDGQRSRDELHALAGDPDIDGTLAQLVMRVSSSRQRNKRIPSRRPRPRCRYRHSRRTWRRHAIS
ncbi:hypothetical protein [Thauera sp. SDU_THAU2]|uniref:hypothetical protein n=1 Tax=Thauera sp. SDU_THAU2 TaxID=3136633 RepID=UPI00311E1B31